MSDEYPVLNGVLDRLGVPRATRGLIIEQHSQPHRHYHTLRHIDLMLRQIPDNHACTREMFVAALFHDIVYDPGKSDNEEQSLSTFLSVAGTIANDGPVDTALVSSMILATKGHQFRDEATASDQAVNLLLKADLSILWHPDPDVYAWYAKGVREEFSFVPDDAFRKARSRILTELRDDLLRSGKLGPDEANLLLRNTGWELH